MKKYDQAFTNKWIYLNDIAIDAKHSKESLDYLWNEVAEYINKFVLRRMAYHYQRRDLYDDAYQNSYLVFRTAVANWTGYDPDGKNNSVFMRYLLRYIKFSCTLTFYQDIDRTNKRQRSLRKYSFIDIESPVRQHAGGTRTLADIIPDESIFKEFLELESDNLTEILISRIKSINFKHPKDIIVEYLMGEKDTPEIAEELGISQPSLAKAMRNVINIIKQDRVIQEVYKDVFSVDIKDNKYIDQKDVSESILSDLGL